MLCYPFPFRFLETSKSVKFAILCENPDSPDPGQALPVDNVNI